MIRYAIGFLLGLIIGAAICSRAHAADTTTSKPPTASMIAACAPDAIRLCFNALPVDSGPHSALIACMVRHRAQLSQQCREAFAK